jgi:hypothetical protein
MPENKGARIVNNKIIRSILIITGTLCVGLGVLGIFLPVLPTTPFLLLAAILYARSSKRFHNWLLTNRIFGSYIRDYNEKKAIKLRSKIIALSMIWITIPISAIFFVPILPVKILLFVIAILVSIHLLKIKTI